MIEILDTWIMKQIAYFAIFPYIGIVGVASIWLWIHILIKRVITWLKHIIVGLIVWFAVLEWVLWVVWSNSEKILWDYLPIDGIQDETLFHRSIIIIIGYSLLWLGILSKNYYDIHGWFRIKTVKKVSSETDLIIGWENEIIWEKNEDDIFLDTFNSIEAPEKKPLKKEEENLTLEQKFIKTMGHIDVSDITWVHFQPKKERGFSIKHEIVSKLAVLMEQQYQKTTFGAWEVTYLIEYALEIFHNENQLHASHYKPLLKTLTNWSKQGGSYTIKRMERNRWEIVS